MGVAVSCSLQKHPWSVSDRQFLLNQHKCQQSRRQQTALSCPYEAVGVLLVEKDAAVTERFRIKQIQSSS